MQDLEAEGLVEREEVLTNVVPHGDRSGVVEPWLMDQWYVNAEKLAAPAIKAVEDGRTKFVPERWSKTYFGCVISSLVYFQTIMVGTSIPAWHGLDDTVFVEKPKRLLLPHQPPTMAKL